MEKTDRKEFDKIMVMIAEMFDKDLSKGLLDLYYHALKDLRLEDIKQATNTLLQTMTFFPKPVDFRNALGGNIEDRATQAWLKALKAQNRYNSVCFDDPVIHSTIEAMGGWVKFCSMEGYTDEKWQMTDFIKIYKGMANRPDHPVKLQGLLEVQNSERGYIDYIPDVKLIGNKEKARLLLESKPDNKDIIKKIGELI